MRKFASNYVSGRVKVKTPEQVSTDRYTYLGLDRAEPNLGRTPDDFRYTFTSSSVNANTNTITINNHGYVTGDKVVYGHDDGVTSVGNLTPNISYFVIELAGNLNEFKLATSKANAEGDQPIIINSTGGAGNHYIGKTTLLSTSLSGERMLVDIGDDLFLEPVGNKFKMKLSPGATQDITQNIVTQTTLQNVTEQGATTNNAISITNDTDAATIGTGALSVAGGISLAKNLVIGTGNKLIYSGANNKAMNITGSVSSGTGTSYVTIGDTFTNSPLKISEPQVTYTANGTHIASLVSTLSLSENFNANSISKILGEPTIEIDPYPHSNIAGVVVIKGDLDVQGNTTTINSQTLDIVDSSITVASNAANSSVTDGAGFYFGDWDTGTTPSITWNHSDTKITVNKNVQANGFFVTGATSGSLLTSDGGTVENDFVSSDTQYSLDATNDGAAGVLTLTDSDGNIDYVQITGNSGITVTSTAANSTANAIISLGGSGLNGTTYEFYTGANASNSQILELNLNALTGNTSADDTVQFHTNGAGNITVGNGGANNKIIITDSLSPVFSGTDAKITVANLTTSSNNASLDTSELSASISGAAHGVVAKFARPDVHASNHGGVILSEIQDDVGAHCSWMSFSNTGDSVDDTTKPVQGEISVKKAQSSNKSGIRIWGQNNIDFDVDSGVSTPSSLNSRRFSITAQGATIRNSGKLTFEQATYVANLEFASLTAGRAITFPDKTGTVALLSDISAQGALAMQAGPLEDEDQFVVFADDYVNSANTTQDPLSNMGFRFNPNTGLMKVGGVQTTGAINVGTQLTAGGNITGSGDLTISGTLTAQSKSFLIDHPTKQNMKLQYGSLEGPENGVYVRGKLQGENVITLPDYWPDLIDEDTISVNLTPIGSHQNLYVDTIQNNQIIIGHTNSINCFFTVFAERKDIDKLVVEYEDI